MKKNKNTRALIALAALGAIYSEAAPITPARVPAFKAGKAFKDAVNV